MKPTSYVAEAEGICVADILPTLVELLRSEGEAMVTLPSGKSSDFVALAKLELEPRLKRICEFKRIARGRMVELWHVKKTVFKAVTE